MPNKQTEQAMVKVGIKRWKPWVLALVCAILAIIFIGSLFMSGYPQYVLAEQRCGHKPIIASNFAGGSSYKIPGDPGYGPDPFGLYYCTEHDAQQASFTHLASP